MLTTRFYRKRLPHWEVDRNVYFVTIRLAGTLPRDVEDQLRIQSQKIRSEPEPARSRLHRESFHLLDNALDTRNMRTLFNDARLAGICVEAIRHRAKETHWDNVVFVIMPNHLHVLFELRTGCLEAAIIDFKRWTTMEARRVTSLNGKSLWQREWFDHWPRSSREDEGIAEYIRNNPVKAGLVDDFRKWPYGSWNT